MKERNKSTLPSTCYKVVIKLSLVVYFIYIYKIINYYSLIDHDWRESNITTGRRLYSAKKKLDED